MILLFALTLLAAPRVLVIGDVPVPKGIEVIALPLIEAQFPPPGVAYRDHAAAHQLWRTIHREGPDVVLTAQPMPSLAAALSGKVPVVTALPVKIAPSALSLARTKRLRRSPREVADELSKVYGHELKDVVYIPAFAVIARYRLGERADVESIVAPYLTGQKDSLSKASSSHFSGHLLFAELPGPAALARVRAAADLAIEQFAQHDEMSDSVFMGSPLLARAGALTGERKYSDAALAHLAFMQKLCLRKDGLYRHSPLDEAAWGRGNAFAALGSALMLSALPNPQPEDFVHLIDALLPYQTKDGMWRQVIDHPTAYEEYSATAMIATSIHLGVRKGWLKGARYSRAVDRAWEAIKMRTDSNGRLMDVCESTGKQKSLEEYLRRTAIWDVDPRGGAMGLTLAVELLAK